MRWTLWVAGFAMTMACGDDTTLPAEGGAATGDTGGDADTSGSHTSTSSDPSLDSTESAAPESDTSRDDCHGDSECPGTEVCTQWSPGDSSCEPSGECSSKVACPAGFECVSASHHTSNGECLPEDPSTSGDSSGDTGTDATGSTDDSTDGSTDGSTG